jgi:hypothetical protein
VADFGSHQVICWHEGEREGEIIVGGNGQGQGSNQLYYSCGLSFDDEGNLHVSNRANHRIQKFDSVL